MTDEARPRSHTDVVVIAVLALVGWVLVVAIGRTWGLLLIEQGRQIVLYTPPVLGGYRPSVPAGVWIPAVTGLVAIVVVPRAASSLRWGWALIMATISAIAWWVSLALVDGTAGLTRGLFWREDFAEIVPQAAASPGGFLRDFVASVPDHPIAVRAHPPGFPLLLALLERVGLSGPDWAVVLVVAGAAAAVPAVLLATRAVAGDQAGFAADTACNICRGEPHTVLDTADALSASIPGAAPPIVVGGYRPGDVRHVFASPEKARAPATCSRRRRCLRARAPTQLWERPPTADSGSSAWLSHSTTCAEACR